MSRLWPLLELELETERLTLRPPDDVALAALADLALRGIHSPDSMPFFSPWTDLAGDEFLRGFAQYFWRQRATWTPEAWALPFAVYLGDTPIGVQQIEATRFPERRAVETSSWVGLGYQRQGAGTEMRAAVLDFAFRVLGAEIALSGALPDNGGSIAISTRLGYDPNGTRREVVRGRPVDAFRFRLTRESWLERTPAVTAVRGFDACAGLFGTGADAALGATLAHAL
jgi:RimJ/RimL family protein N-acetyltransferase